jgi:hypothetical protein
MRRTIAILSLILITACMDNQTYYQYADGSGNIYLIKPDSLQYIPIKPEESSTGFYSGGDPKKVSLTAGQFRTIRAMLETAKTKHDIHLPDRIKTSGMITTFGGQEKNSFILKPGSVELVRIENELKELLK